MQEPNKPPEWAIPYLGPYGPQIYDAACGETIAWGYRVVRRMPDDLFNLLRIVPGVGSLECVDLGIWVFVTKWLTPDEAIEKYGPVTQLDLGPKGGFRSVTYGTKKFLSRKLRP